MDTPRSDVQMWSGTSSAIPKPEFKTTRRGGFEQAQVLEYIGRLTDRLHTVENMQRQQQAQLEQAQGQRDTAIRERDAALQQRPPADEQTFEQSSGQVNELLARLDREVAKIRSDAEAEAAQVVARAESDTARLRREAEESRSSAAHAAERAREEAERSVADLTSRRETMLAELQRTTSGFLDVIGNLAASLDGEANEPETPSVRDGGEVPTMPARMDSADTTVVIPDAVEETKA